MQAKDFCIITGAEETQTTPRPWHFAFAGKETGSYLSLLLDHLYVKVVFNVRVGQSYSKLRTIRMRQMALQSDSIDNMRLTVTLPREQEMTIAYDPPLVAATSEKPLAVMDDTETVLQTDVDKDERPGDVVLHLIGRPVVARALADKIHEIHVDQQKYMISDAVAPKHVYIYGSEIPYLDYSKRADYISQKHAAADKTVLHMMQQRIIAPDKIYENQVVYQFKIFHLLFIFLHHFHLFFSSIIQ